MPSALPVDGAPPASMDHVTQRGSSPMAPRASGRPKELRVLSDQQAGRAAAELGLGAAVGPDSGDRADQAAREPAGHDHRGAGEEGPRDARCARAARAAGGRGGGGARGARSGHPQPAARQLCTKTPSTLSEDTADPLAWWLPGLRSLLPSPSRLRSSREACRGLIRPPQRAPTARAPPRASHQAHELTHSAETSMLSKRMRAALSFGGFACMALLAIWS